MRKCTCAFMILLILISGNGCKYFTKVDIDNRPVYDYVDRCWEANTEPLVMNLTDAELRYWWTAWTANRKLSVSVSGDTMRVDIDSCGQKYEFWGRELDDCYDLSGQPVVKVRARMTGEVAPELGLSLRDINGYVTNLNIPTVKMKQSPEFLDYYFNYSGNWKQGWPDKNNVDPQSIGGAIIFFVNPGGTNWTGTIFIDKIETIPLSELPAEYK